MKTRIEKWAQKHGTTISDVCRVAVEQLMDVLEGFPVKSENPLDEVQRNFQDAMALRRRLDLGYQVLKDVIPGSSGDRIDDVLEVALVDHAAVSTARQVYEEITGRKFRKTAFLGILDPGDDHGAWVIVYYLVTIAHLEVLAETGAGNEMEKAEHKSRIDDFLGSWADFIYAARIRKEAIQEAIKRGEPLVPMEPCGWDSKGDAYARRPDWMCSGPPEPDWGNVEESNEEDPPE